ncbi:MAG: hypothetical protein HQL28_02135, partial [Candidatus Omnitrophica bacterium]|nr:hypothetical protein [Candidatus Omnitrophota bacterium]
MGPILTKKLPDGDYEFYGETVRFDKKQPLCVMAYEYTEDGKRLGFLSDHALMQIAEERDMDVMDMYKDIIDQAAELTASVHALGYLGHSYHKDKITGQHDKIEGIMDDMHVKNMRFILSGRNIKIKFVGDFGAFEKEEYFKELGFDIEDERRIDIETVLGYNQYGGLLNILAIDYEDIKREFMKKYDEAFAKFRAGLQGSANGSYGVQRTACSVTENANPDTQNDVRGTQYEKTTDDSASSNEGPFEFSAFANTMIPDMTLKYGLEISEGEIIDTFKYDVREKFIVMNRVISKAAGVKTILNEDAIFLKDMSGTLIPTCKVYANGTVEINRNFVKLIYWLKQSGLINGPPLEDKETGKTSSLLASIIFSMAMHEITGHFSVKDGALSYVPDEHIAQQKRGNNYSGINLKAMLYFWFVIAEGLSKNELEARVYEFLNK